ncbi:hypothetical protein ACNUDN_02398 [Mycobacterium sp. smrl_JER01]
MTIAPIDSTVVALICQGPIVSAYCQMVSVASPSAPEPKATTGTFESPTTNHHGRSHAPCRQQAKAPKAFRAEVPDSLARLCRRKSLKHSVAE